MNKIFIITFVLITFFGSSKADEFIVNKKLDQLWLDYNEDLVSFIPIEQGLFKKKKVAHIIIDNFDESKFLVFNNISETQLFIGNKLYSVYNKKGRCDLSLIDVKKFVKANRAILTFYSLEGKLPIKHAFIGVKRINADLKKDDFKILNRSYFSQVSIILFLLISGGVLAFVKNSKPITYKAYFDLSMHFKNIEEHVIFNSFSKTAMLLPIIIAILVSVSLSISGYSFFTLDFSFSSWIKLGLDSIVIMLFLFIKFFFLGFLSWIMGIRGLRRSHFFEFIRIAVQFSVILFLSTIFNYGVGGSNEIVLLSVSLIFFIFLTAKLFSTLNREHKFSNLFLFFYFCTAEVFPLFVLVKQLSNIGI